MGVMAQGMSGVCSEVLFTRKCRADWPTEVWAHFGRSGHPNPLLNPRHDPQRRGHISGPWGGRGSRCLLLIGHRPLDEKMTIPPPPCGGGGPSLPPKSMGNTRRRRKCCSFSAPVVLCSAIPPPPPGEPSLHDRPMGGKRQNIRGEIPMGGGAGYQRCGLCRLSSRQG